MFLQRYVHVVLDAVLGSYVKNIDPKALQISVWNGKIEVKTVELQPDAFPLPKQMRLVKGTLRQLRIDLPWTNLAVQPIRVDIEDVSLLLEVCTDDRAASDAAALTPEEQRRAARKKQQNLQRKHAAIDAVEKATEFNEQNNAQTDAGQSWTQSFLCKLLVKALDNVQVHVQHLHLRMEDAVSDSGCPYAVGMTLEAIIIKSADEGWNYTMVGRGTSPPHGMSFIRKKMDVNKFGIYWSLPLVPVPETALNDAEAFAALMRSSFKPEKQQTQLQVVQLVSSPLTESASAQDATAMPTLFKPSDYIVHPLTVSMKLTVNDGNAKLPITHQELSERVLSRLGTSWMVDTIDAIGDGAWNDFLKTMPKLAGERKYTLGFVFSEAWSVARDLTEEEDEIPSVLQFKRALSSCMQWSLEEVDRVEQCIIKYREAVVHVMEEKSTYIDAQASIDQISTSLYRQQYLSALSFISFFTVMRRQARYLVLRPNRIRVRNDPRAWWRYAINAVLLDVRERLAHVDWGALETKQRQKDRYKNLCILVEHSTTFAATLVPPDIRLLSKEIAHSELEDLEYVMDVQELIELRRAVRKEIADTEKEQQALRSKGGSDYKSGGRFPLGPESLTGARLWSYATWLTGAGGSAYGPTDHGAGEVRVEDVKWSDEDANDLYKAIDFHPKGEKEIPELGSNEVEDVAEREKQLLQNHQHILYRFQLTLCRGSFELSLEDAHTDLRGHKGYSNVELSSSSCLTASLDDVEIQFLVWPSSVELGLQLRDAFFCQGPRLSVYDGPSSGKRSMSSSGTRFFLQRMDIDEVVEYHPVGVRNQMSSVRLRYCEKELPLVQLSIECVRQRKIEMTSDSMNTNGDDALVTRDAALVANLFRVSLVTQPIRCNVNLMFLLDVVAVFSRPVNVDLSGLEHSAWKKAQSLQRSSAAQLRDALARRMMVEVRLDMISPLINFIQATIPESRVLKGDEVSLLVFLGHLKAQTKHPSDVVDESEMTKELGDCKIGTTASQMVVLAPSEECLYDVLEISISGIEVQIIDGENISGGNRVFLSRNRSYKKSSWHYLLEKTSLTFNFYMSVTPDDPSIPLLKLSGGVDHVNLNLSATSFRSLVQLMHSFGENLSLYAKRRMGKATAAAAHTIDHPARYLATAASRCSKQKIIRKTSSYMNHGDIALSSSDPGERHTTASGNGPYTHLSKKIQLERQKTFREKKIDDNDLLKLWKRVICQLYFGIGEIILTLQVRDPGNGLGKTVRVRAVDISTRLQVRSYDRRLDFALGTLLMEDILLLRSSLSSKVVEKKRFLMKSGNHEVVIDAEQKSKEEPIKPPTSSEQLIHVTITGIASDAVMLKDKRLWKSVRHAPLSSSSGKNSVWQDPLITALSVDASLRVLTIDVYQDTLADVFVFFFRQSEEDADVKKQAQRPPLLSLRSIGEGSTTGGNSLATNIDGQPAMSPVDAEANENTFSRKFGVWVTSSFLDNHLGASPKREYEQTAANKQCGIVEENQPAAMQSRLNVEGLSLFLHTDDKQRPEGMSSAFASLTAQQFCCCVQRFPLHLSVFAYLTSLKIHDASLLDQHLSEIVSHGDTSTKPDEDKLWNDRDAACEYDDDIALGHIPTQCEILNLLDCVPAVFSCAVQFYGVDTIQEVWHPGYSSRYTVRLKSPRIRFLYSFVDDMCNYWMKGVLLATVFSILSREQTDTLWEGDFQLAGIQGSPAPQQGNEEEDAKVEASSSTISSPDVVSMFPLVDIYLEDAVLEMPPHRVSSESLLLRFDTFRASNKSIVDSFLGMENRVVAKVLLNSSLKQLHLDMKALRIVSVILMDHNDTDKRLGSGGPITQSLLGLTNYSLSIDFRSHVDMKVSIICSPVCLVCNQDQYAFLLRVPFQNYRERTRYNFRPGAEVSAKVAARASSRRFFLRHSVDGFSSSGRFIEDGDEASDGTGASEVPEVTEERHFVFDLHVPEITMEILQGRHGYHPSSSDDLDMVKKSEANDASICLLALSVLSARADYDLVNHRLTADVDLEGVHIRDSRVHSKMSASYRDVIVFERCRVGLPKAIKLQLVHENFDMDVSTIRFDPHRHKLQASGTRFRRTSSRASVGLFGSELSLRRTDSEISVYSLKSPTVANRGTHCDKPREKKPSSSLVGVEERMELVIDVAGFKIIPSNIHYELIEFLATPPSWSTEDVDSVSSRGNEETGNADSEESTVVPPTYRRIGLELNLGPSAFLLVEDPYKLKSRAMVLSWESSVILNYLRQTNEDECPDVEGISEEYPAHSRNQLQFCVDLENIYATSRLSEESIWAAEQAATAASADCLKPIGMESVFQVDLRSHFVRFQTTFDRVMELRFGYLDFCTMLAAFEHVLCRPLTTSQSSGPRGQNRRSMSGSSISSLSGGGLDSESASCGGRRHCPSSPRSSLALFMSKRCERQCTAALYGTSLIYLVSASFRGRLETRPVVGFYNSTWRKRYLVLPYTAQQRQLVQSVAFRILPASESRRQIGDEVYYGDRIILEAVVTANQEKTEEESSKVTSPSKAEASDTSPTAGKETAKLPHSTLIQKYDQLGANGYLGPEGSAGVFETTIWKHGSTMFNSDKSVIYDRELIVFEEVTIYRSFSKGKTFGAANDAGQQMDFNLSRSGHQAEGAHTVDATSARGGGYLMFNGVGDAPIPFALSIVSGTSGAGSPQREEQSPADADNVDAAGDAVDSSADASVTTHPPEETPSATARSGNKKRKSLFECASFLDNLKILEFTLPGVNATIVNDFHNMLLPLLHFRVAALNADIRGRLEYKFTALTSLRFGIQAYNSQLAVWEPVLEDFEMNMAYHGMGGLLCDYCMSERQSLSPTGAALRCDGMPLCLFRSSRTEVFTDAAAHSWESKNYIYRELLEQPDVQDGAKLANTFMVVAKDDFNINVSRNVINVLVHFFALVTEVTAADEALSSRLGPFIYVDNQSGIPFVVATHPSSSVGAASTVGGTPSSSRRPTGSIEMPTDVPGADTNDEIIKAGTAMFNSLAWSRRRLSTMLSDISSADTRWIRVESGERIATEIVAHEAPAGCVTSPLRRLLWLKPQSHSQGITSSKAIPVPIGYSNRSYLHLESSGKQHDSWHGESIICETVAEQGTLVLRLRGKVQLTNFYDIPIQIIYNDQREETIEPGGMTAHYIPIQYLDSGSIVFRPLLSNGEVQRSDALSIASLLRSNDFKYCGRSKRRQNVGSLELRKALTFYWDVHPGAGVEDGADTTFDVSLPPFQVILTALRKSERHETTITLRPPIVLENLVPYELSYRTVCMKSEAEVVWVAKNAASFSGANGKVPSGSSACLAELDILERDLENGEVAQTPTVVGLSLALPQIELRRFSRWSSDAFIYGCRSFCERIELNMRDDSEAEATTVANKLTICVEITQLEKLRSRSLNTLCPVVCRVFTEYWLIDRTSLSLAFYTADDYLIPSNHPSRLYEGNGIDDDNSSPVSLSVFSCESKQSVSKMKIGIKGSAGEREVQSESFDISAVGVRGQILVPTNRSRDARFLLSTITEFGAPPGNLKSTFTQYEFGVMIEQGPEKFLRSRVVTLVPRYYFNNTSNRFEIHVRQERSTDPNSVVVLRPNDSKIFHWSDSRLPFRVQVCFVLPDKRHDACNIASFVNSSQWTAPFELSAVGNFVLRVKSKVRPAPPCLPGCFEGGGASNQKPVEEVEDLDVLFYEDDERNDAKRMLTDGIQLNVAVELHDPSFLVYLEESSPSVHVSPPPLSDCEANYRKHVPSKKQKKEDEAFVPFKIKNECSNLALIVWQKTRLKDGKGNVTIGFEGGESVLPFHSIDYVPFRFSAFPTVFIQVQKVAGLGVKALRKKHTLRGHHGDRMDSKSSGAERKKGGSPVSALSRAAMLDQAHVVTSFEVQLKKLQCLPTIDVSEGSTKKRLWAEVLLDETTKTLLVTDMLPGFSGEHKRRRRATLLRSWKRYNTSIVFISHMLSTHAAHMTNGPGDDLSQEAPAPKKCVRFVTDGATVKTELSVKEDEIQRAAKLANKADSIPSSTEREKEVEALALCARLVDAGHLEEVFLQAGRSDLTSCLPFITFSLKTAEGEVRTKLTPQSSTLFPRWLPALHSKTTLSALVLSDDGGDEKNEERLNHEFGADAEIIVEIREADKVLFGSSVVAATRIPLQEYCAAAMISCRSDANYEAPVVEFLAPVRLTQTGGGWPRSLGNETRIRFQMCCRRTSTTRSAIAELNGKGVDDHNAVKEVTDILSAYQLKKELDLLLNSKSQLKMLLEHEAVDTSTSGSNIPAALRPALDRSTHGEKNNFTLSHLVAGEDDGSGDPCSQSANSIRGSAASVTTDGSVSDGTYDEMIDEKRLTAVLIGVSNLQIPTEVIRDNFKHTHRKVEHLEPKVYCTITYQKSTRSALSAVAKSSSTTASMEQDKSDDSKSTSSGGTSMAGSPSNHAHLQQVRTHEFMRGQALGLDLVYRNGRVLVQGVVCDGPCGALVYEGKIRIGDTVVAVNKKSIVNLHRNASFAVIEKAMHWGEGIGSQISSQASRSTFTLSFLPTMAAAYTRSTCAQSLCEEAGVQRYDAEWNRRVEFVETPNTKSAAESGDEQVLVRVYLRNETSDHGLSASQESSIVPFLYFFGDDAMMDHLDHSKQDSRFDVLLAECWVPLPPSSLSDGENLMSMHGNPMAEPSALTFNERICALYSPQQRSRQHSALEMIGQLRLALKWDFINPLRAAHQQRDLSLHFQLEVARICISVVDDGAWSSMASAMGPQQPREVLCISLSDQNASAGVQLSYGQISDGKKVLNARIGHFQIDNQLLDTNYPVLLRPIRLLDAQTQEEGYTMVRGEGGKENAETGQVEIPMLLPTVQLMTVFSHQPNVVQFDYIFGQLQELEIKLEDATLVALARVFSGVKWSHPALNSRMSKQDKRSSDGFGSNLALKLLEIEWSTPTLLSTAAGGRLDSTTSGGGANMKVLLRWLLLCPVKVNVTFTSTADRSLLLSLLSPDMSSALSTLISAAAALVSNLDQAPIRIPEFYVENLLETTHTLAFYAMQHYLHHGLRSWYSIMGSVDFLGNPIGLVSTLGTGVKDFFYTPAQMLLEDENGLRIDNLRTGMTKGSKSLLRNTAVGIFHTAGKITETLGKGVALLAMDEQYYAQRQRASTRQIKKINDIGDGIAEGSKGLVGGVWDGIKGVVAAPVRGAEQDGAGGFVVGIGKGVAGLIAKPTAGFLDLLTSLSRGAKTSAQSLDGTDRNAYDIVTRFRLPRRICLDGVLVSYSEREARGYAVLLLTPLDATDDYVYHVDYGIEPHRGLLLLTDKRLICLSGKTGQKLWEVALDSTLAIVVEGTTLKIGQNTSPSRSYNIECDSEVAATNFQVAVDSARVDVSATRYLLLNLEKSQEESRIAGGGRFSSATTGLLTNDEDRTDLHVLMENVQDTTVSGVSNDDLRSQPLRSVRVEVCHLQNKDAHANVPDRAIDKLLSFSVFQVQVYGGPYQWTVFRRFSEFRKLCAKLEGGGFVLDGLPLLPPRTFLPSTRAPVAKHRQDALNMFLQAAIMHSAISRSAAMLDFLTREAREVRVSLPPLSPAGDREAPQRGDSP